MAWRFLCSRFVSWMYSCANYGCCPSTGHRDLIVIKFTLNAKGVWSRASCYRLINFGTERSECQHWIVHANLISKFDSTALFASSKNFQLLRCCRKIRQQNFTILVTQRKLWVVVARLCRLFFDPHFRVAKSTYCVHFSTIPSSRGWRVFVSKQL